MLTRAQIRTIARQFSSDTDATNPFWSDTNVNLLIESWQSDMASYLRYPRATGSAITMVAGQNNYALPEDWMSTIRIFIYSGSTYQSRLIYKSEDEISDIDPNWRNAASGAPRYYFAANDITASTVLSRKFFIYPAPDTANTKSMLHVYVKVPTAISGDTNIPVFPGPMHILAVYYCAWQMLLALDQVKAKTYETLYLRERLRMCGEGRKETEEANTILFK